eukprot:TRINITY_DN6987_c0_g1_i1.p1 TRINITY_DN6987_c0_g1~~TRINITY_DN6987_c0_g1_i1.p1  ORF type:complete len:304 (-),score=67.18 TRINITY_DN6987_c0_g1_i1:730-1641(-)
MFDVLSDVHLSDGRVLRPHARSGDLLRLGGRDEFERRAPNLVVCGDMFRSSAKLYRGCLQLLSEMYPDGVTYVVLGNHDYYHAKGDPRTWDQMERAAMDAAEACSRDNVRVLRPGVLYKTDGVWVAGCTAWTEVEDSLLECQFADYDNILTNGADRGALLKRVQVGDVRAWHASSVAWLEDALCSRTQGATLIATHHCPLPGAHFWAEQECFRKAYCFDARPLLRAAVEGGRQLVWAHGHTHVSHVTRLADSVVVVANCLGYLGPKGGDRGTGFSRHFSVRFVPQAGVQVDAANAGPPQPQSN